MSTSLDTSAGGNANFGTAASWSHTCSASATGLFVGVSAAQAQNQAHTTSVKYNGVAMSSITSGVNALSGNTCEGSLWYLANPTSGANTVSVTLSDSAHIAGLSASVIGGSTTSVPGAPQLATASANATATVSSIANGSSDLVIGFFAGRKPDTITINSIGPNETSLGTQGNGTGGASALASMDYKSGTGSTTSVTFNLSGTDTWVTIGVAAIVAAGGGGGGGSTGTGSFFYFRRRRI